ncbi:peptide-methionine (S)-S-oxide reductase MsrA [Nitrospira sp. Kam-Ns4a]
MTETPGAGSESREIATLAGGCFWCLEAVYDQMKGVESVESGYTGGRIPNPSYEAVCTGCTGHAEAVRIAFDPKVVSYLELLEVFFAIHDPTTLNRQGNDVGTQYRSAIFYHSPEQRATAEAMIAELTRRQVFERPIVTELAPAGPFYVAEAYHQEYFARNPSQPYCTYVVGPKVAKARKLFAEKMKGLYRT